MVDVTVEQEVDSSLPLETNGHDVTPTGYARIGEVADGKLKGTSADEKVTLYDLGKDSDQVVFTMGGDDVLVFGVGDDGPQYHNEGDPKINAIVDMGDGADSVYLTHFFEDYEFTLRNDSVKIQYVGSGGNIEGAAVTVRNAETFVFRNIDEAGHNHVNTEMSYAQLRTAIEHGFNSDYGFIT
jgi:hypothetical protein